MAAALASYWAFPALLGAALLMSRWLDLRAFADRIHRFLRRRGFSRNENLATEIVRLELARIICGLILAHRTLYTILYLPPDATPAELFAAWSVLVAAISFAAGVLTPAVGLFLVLLAHPADNVLRTMTLGTDVLQMLLLVLVFAPVGQALSLDAAWGARVPLWRGALAALRRLFGPPTVARISVLRFLGLISYGVLCLYSVFFHFTDPAWMEGYANALLLTSSYLSQHHGLFRDWFAAYPGVGLRIAEAALYAMIAWELLLVPFVLHSAFTRNIVVVWGVLFFIVSTFVLQLGWLPYYEYVLWAVLFWQGAWLDGSGRATMELLYDDRCNLCDRTVRFLSRADLFGIVSFRPLSRNPELLGKHGLSAGAALQDLYGIDQSGRIFKGYDLYTDLARRVLLLFPAWPPLVVGRWLRIGPRVYRWIAARRIRLFGVCERAAPLPAGVRSTLEAKAATVPQTRQPMLTALLIAYLVLLAAFLPRLVLLPAAADSFGPWRELDQLARRWLGRAHELVGLNEINVFNANDLRMSEGFFTVEARGADGILRMLPFTGPLGERLGWHYSDRVYFANSLAYRRYRPVDHHYCYRESHLPHIREIVAWGREDAALQAPQYLIRYYFQPLPEAAQLKRYEFRMPDIQPVCEVVFDAASGAVARVARRPQQEGN
jgi:predicted DCC family thiol-disulfide oxidoreductase YuxK